MGAYFRNPPKLKLVKSSVQGAQHGPPIPPCFREAAGAAAISSHGLPNPIFWEDLAAQSVVNSILLVPVAGVEPATY